jgi:hypothetical protein
VKFYWANTSLPPNAYAVQVTNPAVAGGLSETLAAGFTVLAPQPTISSTSPNPVTRGVSPSGSVTIFGSGFVLGATITVGSLTGTTVSGATATAGTPFVFTNSGNVKFYWQNLSLPVDSYDVNVTNSAAAGSLGGTLVDGFVVQ